MNIMNKVLKSIVAMVIWLSAVSANAHQPDISTCTLIEQENGQWTMQLNASMTAFQYEVRNAYGEDSYTSPEEFNQLLLKHLREHITIHANGEEVTLGNGSVQLGHATTVAFELSGVSEALEEVFVINKGFENIHNSKIIFSIIKEGFDRSGFILSEANDYQINVSLEDNQVLLIETSSTDYWMVLIVVMMILGLLGILLFRSNLRNTSFQQTTILSHP